MNPRNLLPLVIILIMSVVACKKDLTPTPQPPNPSPTADTVYLGLDSIHSDDMSDVEYQLFEQIEDTVRYPLDSLVLSDGELVTAKFNSSKTGKTHVNGISPPRALGIMTGGSIAQANVSKLSTFFKKMINKGQTLSGPMHFDANDIKPYGPEQFKIAYVIGPLVILVKGKKQFIQEGKDYTIRSKTPACTDNLHGLDCSAFVNYMFNAGGAQFPPFDDGDNGAEGERDVDNIQAAIKSPVGDANLFEVKDLPNTKTTDMQAGDIFYDLVDGAKIADHVGIIGQAGVSKTQFLLHSWGNQTNCKRNSSSAGGPIAWSFAMIAPNYLIQLKDAKGKVHTASLNVVRIRYIAELEAIPSTVNQSVANTIQVKVFSSDGMPVNNIRVNFATLDNSFSQDVLPIGGVATASWTPGNNPGSQTCVATVKSPVDNSTILDQVSFVSASSTNSFSIQTVTGDNGTYNQTDNDDNFDWNYVFGPMPLSMSLHFDGSNVSGNFTPDQNLDLNGNPFILSGTLSNNILNLNEHDVVEYAADDEGTNPNYGHWKVETSWNFNGTLSNGNYSGTFTVIQTQTTNHGPQKPAETITSTGVFNDIPIIY